LAIFLYLLQVPQERWWLTLNVATLEFNRIVHRSNLKFIIILLESDLVVWGYPERPVEGGSGFRSD